MCHQCNYRELLKRSGLGYTPHRLRILEIVGNNTSPLSAQEIFTTLNRTRPINRVTVYRVLDALVDHGLVSRLSGGGRSFFYGLAPNANHSPHPHFYCTTCGDLTCLDPGSLTLSTDQLKRTFPGQIQNVEIRIDGICKGCLKSLPGGPT
ncbi:MAG: Fur family transcriptional regulator [Desulfobacterales bacterium]